MFFCQTKIAISYFEEVMKGYPDNPYIIEIMHKHCNFLLKKCKFIEIGGLNQNKQLSHVNFIYCLQIIPFISLLYWNINIYINLFIQADMIFLLIQWVTATSIYPVSQIQYGLTFQIEFEGGSMTLDMNSPLSTLNVNGTNIKCNQTVFGEKIKCNKCQPDCQINQQQLQQSQINLEDVFGETTKDSILYLQESNNDILGIGPLRGKNYPQNPFVSDIFHICLGYTRGFITREFKNKYNWQLKYSDQSQKYEINLENIQIENGISFNISGITTILDTIQPYIMLPEQIYNQMVNYFQDCCGVKEKQKLLYTNGSEIPHMYFMIDGNNITMYNTSYVYTLQDQTKILALYKSKHNRIELGLPFLAQKLITIKQSDYSIYGSEYNCQEQFDYIHRNPNLVKQIFIPLVLVVVVISCILRSRAPKPTQETKFQELSQVTHEEVV